jgi:hypothetical protein
MIDNYRKKVLFSEDGQELPEDVNSDNEQEDEDDEDISALNDDDLEQEYQR